MAIKWDYLNGLLNILSLVLYCMCDLLPSYLVLYGDKAFSVISCHRPPLPEMMYLSPSLFVTILVLGAASSQICTVDSTDRCLGFDWCVGNLYYKRATRNQLFADSSTNAAHETYGFWRSQEFSSYEIIVCF